MNIINSKYTSAFFAIGRRYTLDMTVFIDSDGRRCERRYQIDEASLDDFMEVWLNTWPTFSCHLEPVGLSRYCNLADPKKALGRYSYEYSIEALQDLLILVEQMNRRSE